MPAQALDSHDPQHDAVRPGASPVDDARSRCATYRRVYRLPAQVLKSDDRIVIVRETASGLAMDDREIGGISLPAKIAIRVQEALSASGLGGPVIEDLRSRRFTLLADPEGEVDWDLLIMVSGSVMGCRILLPSPTDEAAGLRRWVQLPTDGVRPTFSQVFTALKACAYSGIGYPTHGGQR